MKFILQPWQLMLIILASWVNRQLMRALKLKAADFDQIVLTLCEQGEIESIIIETATKPARGYQLGSVT